MRSPGSQFRLLQAPNQNLLLALRKAASPPCSTINLFHRCGCERGKQTLSLRPVRHHAFGHAVVQQRRHLLALFVAQLHLAQQARLQRDAVLGMRSTRRSARPQLCAMSVAFDAQGDTVPKRGVTTSNSPSVAPA